MLLRNLVTRAATHRSLFEGTLSAESIGKKLLVIITGYKVPSAKVREKWHIYPMEDLEDSDENSPKRKLIIVPKDEGRDAIVGRLFNAIDTGKVNDGVWATPGLPMLIFVTIGLIVALIFGDLVWIIVSFFLG